MVNRPDRQDATARYAMTVHSSAGMYDYLLGGTNHSDADSRAAEKALAVVPETRFAAVENRAFAQRAVRYAAEHGVRQYLDLGSGLPAAGPVHEVAGKIVADPHVVYVDFDPWVVVRGREMLTSAETIMVGHDLRRPRDIIADRQVAHLINWSEPVAVLMTAVLHYVHDTDQLAKIIAALRERMTAGSYLILSHVSQGSSPDWSENAARIWHRDRPPVTLRTAAEIRALFTGFELLPPGLVTTAEWGTTESEPVSRPLMLAGVGVLPAGKGA
jgi:O-methyltransferase involved in polyketide biosynthesis